MRHNTLNTKQIRLVQAAVRGAGLRRKGFDGRYRLLLGKYTQPNKKPVTSCKQLNNSQLEDLLAICEAHGWRMPGKKENYFQSKRTRNSEHASFAQQSAVKHLAGDLGWNDRQLGGMLKRMTGGFASNVTSLSPGYAYRVIEALKAMVGRGQGKQYSNLREVQTDMEVVTDGSNKTNQVG